jgi:hypothetical protein
VTSSLLIGSVLIMAAATTGVVTQGGQTFLPSQTTASVCGDAVPVPPASPPKNMTAVIYAVTPCLVDRAGRLPRTSAEIYARDIKLQPSRPADGIWMPYDSVADRVILDDFRRLWKNHQLQNLSIEIRDHPFPNGVVGKLVIYNITERR